MKENKITELVFIIDASGSMAGFEDDTVGGFNSMIASQREVEGQVKVSTVLFDNTDRVIHDRVDISAVEPLTRESYRVGGCTALYDAVGGAIRHISNIHKYARPEDVPAHTVFVITTDGMENASRQYGGEAVRRMIKEKTEAGWEFIFLAANIDVERAARDMGIRSERAAKYIHTSEGVDACYEAASNFLTMTRCNMEDDGAWRQRLDEMQDL